MCLNDTVMKQQLGVELSAQLQIRLADLAAVDYVSELLAGKPRELHGDRSDQMSLCLAENTYLIFKCGHTKPRTLDSGQVDWSNVSRIKILGIETL
jgi:hypothetical protein